MPNDKDLATGLFASSVDTQYGSITKLSIKVDDFVNSIKSKGSDWVNIDLKTSRSGKLYAEFNNYKPDNSGGASAPKTPAPSQTPSQDYGLGNDDLPF